MARNAVAQPSKGMQATASPRESPAFPTSVKEVVAMLAGVMILQNKLGSWANGIKLSSNPSLTNKLRASHGD
jgi:hypothetical protein